MSSPFSFSRYRVTYLLTPNLVLEANEVMRRYRWPFAIASLLSAAFAYLDPGLGVMVLVASFLISAGNIRQAWIAQALGEQEYFDFMRMAAARFNRRAALASVLGNAVLIALTGVYLLLFYPSPSRGWYFALGNFELRRCCCNPWSHFYQSPSRG